MPYRPTAQTKAHRHARRERLLKAAHELVAAGGYGAVSMAAVAARAGVGTGSVYTYFPAKDELLAEVFRRASQHEVDASRRATATGTSAVERLSSFVEVCAERAL